MPAPKRPTSATRRTPAQTKHRRYRISTENVAPIPPAASNRAYLRNSLPSIYQDDDFAMRFVYGFEQVIDPIFGLLDQLPAHFSAHYAPDNILELLASWIGERIDESHEPHSQRQIVLHAAQLGRTNGTKAGLELALKLAYPDITCRVIDSGSTNWSRTGEAPSHPKHQHVWIEHDEELTDQQLNLIQRFASHRVPVNTSLRFRKSRKKSQQ